MSIQAAIRTDSARKLFVALVVSLPLMAQSPEGQAQASASTDTRSSTQQGVTVNVTPKAVGAGKARWQFAVVLDTHSGDLSDDLAKTATLVIDDGREFKPVAWVGAAPGGHHREGVLEFALAAPWPTAVELRLQRPGEASPRVYRWQF